MSSGNFLPGLYEQVLIGPPSCSRTAARVGEIVQRDIANVDI
jgi:hypothetical protein